MYTGLLHSHKLFVLLFVLHYVFKLVMLLLDKKEMLAKYTKVTRIPEMVISVGFLITGGWMLIKGAIFSNFIIIKLICVFASIPLAVIGFQERKQGAGICCRVSDYHELRVSQTE